MDTHLIAAREPHGASKKRDTVAEFNSQHAPHQGLHMYRGLAEVPHGTRSGAHGKASASDVTAERIMHDATFKPAIHEDALMIKPEPTREDGFQSAGAIQEYFKENRAIHSVPPSSEDSNMVQTRANRSEMGQLQLIQQAPHSTDVVAIDAPPHEFTRNKRSDHDTPSMPHIFSPFEPAPVTAGLAANENTRIKKTEKVDTHVKDTVQLSGGQINLQDVRSGNLESTRIKKCEKSQIEEPHGAASMMNAKPALASWSTQPEGTRLYKTKPSDQLRGSGEDIYKDINVSAPPMDVNQFSVQARDNKVRRDGISATYNGVLSTPKVDLAASATYTPVQVKGNDTKAQRQAEQQSRLDQFDMRKGAALAMTPVVSSVLQAKPSRDAIQSPLAETTLSAHQHSVLDQQRRAATSNLTSATRHGRGSKNEGTKDADLKHKLGLLSIQQLPRRPFDAEAHLRAPMVTKQRDSSRGNVMSVVEAFGDADNDMGNIVNQENDMMPLFTRLDDAHPLESIEHSLPVLPDWQTLIDLTREHRPNPTRLNGGRNEVDASDQIKANIQLNMHTGPSKHMISKLVPCNSKDVVIQKEDRQPHGLQDIRIARLMPSIEMENALNRNSQEHAHKKLATEKTAREIVPSQAYASTTLEPKWDRFGQDTRSAYKVPAKYLKN